MCPACIANATVIAAGVGSTGGVLAVCIGKFRKFFRSSGLGLFQKTKECRSQGRNRRIQRSMGLPIRNRSIRSKPQKMAACWPFPRAGLLPTVYGRTTFRDGPEAVPGAPPQ